MKQIVTILIVIIFSLSSQAASILSSNVANFSNASILVNVGSVVYAIDSGTSSGTTTVNGISFVAENSSYVGLPSGGSNTASVFMTTAATTALGNTNFSTVLNSGDYAFSGTTGYLTLKSLTIGQTYALQLLVADTRSSQSGRTIVWSDSASNATTALGSATTYAFTDGSPSIGQSTILTFTADATTQQIYYASSIAFSLNALILEAVAIPEPSIVVLGAMGMLTLVWYKKKK